jgi:hypothetical protein
VNVAGIVQRRGLEPQRCRRNDEGENLVATRRAVGTDLVVERHDILSVIGAEQDDVSTVRLRYERFNGASGPGIGAVYRQRVTAGRGSHTPRLQDGSSGATLEVNRAIGGTSRQETYSWVGEQCVVET